MSTCCSKPIPDRSVILFLSLHTGSYETGKPRVELEVAALQRLYAPVVAAHANRSRTVQELAGALC